MTDQVTALYRFYSDSGELLYVGISDNPARRWREHGAAKPWWHEVASTTIERYASRELADSAERSAIRSESPRYNRTHNPTPGRPGPVVAAQVPTPTGYRGVAVGDVIAVRLDSGGPSTCPVGMVESVDEYRIGLYLYSWAVYRFTAGERAVSWTRVRSLMQARRLPSDRNGTKVFDMDPLAAFQTEWTGPPVTMPDPFAEYPDLSAGPADDPFARFE